jgi:diaminohydroxyphosphoribosylaminopyrimidine deaminase/5-amino-6-(5-phosphoribosylamino)uracil reductase
VIVNAGRIVGRGWTQPGGRPHAETQALAQAGEAARAATAYVTLEPCAHHGKTPPCAQALVQAGVSRVVCALGDPDPRVDGGGFATLRAAGIIVETGLMAPAARTDHAGFLLRITENRPFLTLKIATTLDGRIATANGDSQWITGPQARRAVHAMRARHDAVLVGAGTARADDPGLTVRGLGVARQPVRVVISGALDLPLTGQLARTARDVPVWLIHGPQADPARIEAWQALGATCLSVEAGAEGRPDPRAALAALAGQGLTRVLCEGGGALAASLLQAGCVDRLVLFAGGALIGADGRAALGPLGLTRLAQAPRMVLEHSQPIGPDLLHIWRPA